MAQTSVLERQLITVDRALADVKKKKKTHQQDGQVQTICKSLRAVSERLNLMTIVLNTVQAAQQQLLLAPSQAAPASGGEQHAQPGNLAPSCHFPQRLNGLQRICKMMEFFFPRAMDARQQRILDSFDLMKVWVAEVEQVCDQLVQGGESDAWVLSLKSELVDWNAEVQCVDYGHEQAKPQFCADYMKDIVKQHAVRLRELLEWYKQH